MNGLADLPLHGVAIYNPDLLSKQELVSQFVARRALLDRLLEDLGRAKTTQHHLIVGQRGMGKTTLLRRLSYAVEDDPTLAATWLPLTFPEEQYNVARLSDLYLNLIDALGDALDRMGRSREAKELDAAREQLPDRDEGERARRALDLLRYGADRVERRLLLLVDNIDLIFDRLKAEQWAIRELLASEPRLLLVGASAVMLESTYEYKAPFYDFFLTHELRGLGEEETREVLLHLAKVGNAPEIERVVTNEPGRIKTFHVLAGGNPRTVVLLYDVLAKGVEGDVRTDLERLLDRVTPLYKARFEALPAQAQQIMHELANHWDPMSAGELAAAVRLEVNAVSSQLNRLERDGVVEKVAYPPGKKAGFQVAERLFNIWYLMRASRRVRQRLIWLVEFLRMLYAGERIRGEAERYLRGGEGTDPESRMRRAEYGLALAQVVEEAPLRGALESVSVRALAVDKELRAQLAAIMDLEGEDASLKPVVDRHKAMAEIKETVFAAKVTWEGCGPEAFWELLGGSMALSLEEKARIARDLAKMSPAQRSRLVGFLEGEVDIWEAFIRCKRSVRALRTAFARGYLADLRDTSDAEAASLALGAPEIAATALAARMDSAFDPSLLDNLATVADVMSLPFSRRILGDLLCERLGRYEPAASAYRKAIDADPAYVDAWRGLADVLQDHLGSYEEAEAAYRRAIALEPKRVYLWNRLGNLLEHHLRRDAEAEAAYLKATELNPRSARAWRSLGSLLASSARWTDAEPRARKFLAEAPLDFLVLAWADILRFFREAARTGHAADAVRLLDDLSLTDRFRPLREALAAIAAGSKLPLLRIAPEIRRPAEELLDTLWPQGLE